MLKTPKRIRNHVNPLAYTEEIFFDGFDDKNPIIMDIGSYRGEFGKKLVERFSKQYVIDTEGERNFIFTEIRKPFSQYLEKLFAENLYENKNGPKNVKIFGGNTATNMENILRASIEKGVTVEKIFVNFPDPWFKKKHHKRRVVWGEFLDNLKSWLPEETDIIFQTDQKGLFFETLAEIQKREFLDWERFSEPLWGVTTYWEDMKTSEGKKIWRMKIYIKSDRRKKTWKEKIVQKIQKTFSL